MPRRLDAQDTVDIATHLLHRLQAEGWVLEEMEHEIEYVRLDPKAPRLPVRATVVVRLIPVR